MLLQNAMHDLRFALRQLRKNPGFTALAVGTLALGITANITIFSWINSTLLNPIPGIAHTSNMITIMRGERNEHPTPPFSYLDYADLRDSAHSFSGLLGYHDDYMAITGSGQPERIYGTLASSNYFEVLGVRPILGRSLLPSLGNERTGAAEAVLGYDLWQKRYGGDPVNRRQDNSDQPPSIYDCRRCAQGLSGMQDRPSLRHMDSAGDGQAGLGFQPHRLSRHPVAQRAGQTQARCRSAPRPRANSMC